MTEKKRELIKTIAVIPSNLEHIAKTGIINGTLLVEIERVMEAYAAQQSEMPTREKCDKKMFEILSQPTSLGKDLRGVRSPAMMMAEYSEWLRNQIG